MNPDQDLLTELALPDKSFRLFALEQAIQHGSTKDLLTALEERELQEDDEECRILLSHAVRAVKARLGMASPDGEDQLGAPFSPATFRELPAAMRLSRLQKMSAEERLLLEPDLVEFIEAETDPAVLGVLLWEYAGTWDPSKEGFFQGLLFSPRAAVRLRVLEILVHRSPRGLQQFLPDLLISPDCRMQALAIRGLAAIDPGEAVLHFENLLLSAEYPRKLAALQISIYLPFETIRESLIRFAAVETDPGLLEKVCLILAHNPDREIPFRLWEIAENAPRSKASLITSVLSPLCKNLKASDLLGTSFGSFMEQLQDWLYRRNARKLVQSFLERLQNPTPAVIAELQAILRKSGTRPQVREAFIEALSWPLSEETKNALGSLLAEAEPERSLQSDEEPLEALPEDERIRRVAFCPDLEAGKTGPILDKAFSLASCHSDLLATALRSALKAGLGVYVPQAKAAARSDSPNVVSAAIEYLAVFAQDELFPTLGKYLQSTQPRIKSAALKILRQHDCAQGLSILKALLSKPDTTQNQVALGCMVYFDFSLVRDLLADFLGKTRDRLPFLQGLCLLQANADPECLYRLYRLAKDAPGEFALDARQAYDAAEAQLLRERRIPENPEKRKAEFEA